MNNQDQLEEHHRLLRERAQCELHDGRGALLPIAMVVLAIAMSIGMIIGYSIAAYWNSLPVK